MTYRGPCPIGELRMPCVTANAARAVVLGAISLALARGTFAQDAESAPVLLDDSTITFSASARPGATIIVPLPALDSIAFDPDGDPLGWAFSDEDDGNSVDERHANVSVSGFGDRWAVAFTIARVVPETLRVDLVVRESSTEQNLESDDRLTVVLMLVDDAKVDAAANSGDR